MAAQQPSGLLSDAETTTLAAHLRRGNIGLMGDAHCRAFVSAALAAGADAAATFRLQVPGAWQSVDVEDEDFGVTISMLGVAAMGNCAAAVPLLIQAGAEVQLRDINQAIEEGSPGVLAALLAVAQPAPPGGDIDIDLDWAEPHSADPLWTALQCAAINGQRRTAAMIEQLLAAGYRPVTYALAAETDGLASWLVSRACSLRIGQACLQGSGVVGGWSSCRPALPSQLRPCATSLPPSLPCTAA